MTYRQLVHAASSRPIGRPHFYVVNPTTGQISRAADATKGLEIDELNFAMFFGLAIDAYEDADLRRVSVRHNTMSGAAQVGQNLFTGNSPTVRRLP